MDTSKVINGHYITLRVCATLNSWNSFGKFVHVRDAEQRKEKLY
jgi:hypothetical protein